ncbi:MAG: amino acid ABC transporter permease [Brachymonas sp.]|nr:amino acid ABC transporter permease [Brachymonas sp.]
MNWDWQAFCKDKYTLEVVPGCFGEDTYLNWVFKAWGWTAAVSVGALLLALLVGAVIGVMRTLPQDRPSGRIFYGFGTAWVELFRNIPLLVQIFIWYFVLPVLVPVFKGLPSFVLVVFALGFFTSARIAEQVRAGIQSLPRGQRNAAQALGMSTWQTYRYVLMPMAVRIILPPLTSESMNLVKNSSAAFAVSVAELTQYAMQVAEETSRPIEVYLVVTVLYIITALLVNRVLGFIEKRTRVPGLIVASRTPGGR